MRITPLAVGIAVAVLAVPASAVALSHQAPVTSVDVAEDSPFVRDVTTATWKKDVVDESAQRVVIVDFGTSWCGPCLHLKPILKAKAAKDRTWVLALVDAEKNKPIAQHVSAYPTFETFFEGRKRSIYKGDTFEENVMKWIDTEVKKFTPSATPAPMPSAPAPSSPAPAPTTTPNPTSMPSSTAAPAPTSPTTR